MKRYPKCFPENFETDILPKGAREENKPVYRIIKSGILNRDSFLSTLEEELRGLKPPSKNIDLNDPGIYSTSCFVEFADAEYILKVLMRHNPPAIIAKGETERTCGPCQLTSEREERKNTHVDWWIFEESDPQKYFKEVGENE